MERIATLENELGKDTVTQVITLTEGTSSAQTIETGGTQSTTIDTAKVAFHLKDIFSAELGCNDQRYFFI